MKKINTLIAATILASNMISSQPSNYSWDKFGNGNSQMTVNSPANGIISQSSQASGSPSNYYLVEWDSYWNKWSNTSTPFNSVFTLNWGGGSYNGPNGSFSTPPSAFKYYTMQIRGLGYSNRQAVVMETDNAPQSFHSTANTAVSTPTVYPGQDATITISLAGAKSPQERVFIRYSTNNFATSNIAEATASGATWSTANAIIPSNINIAGAQIKYYAYTTTVSATSSSDHDLITLRFGNNGGSNYTYTVANNYTPAALGGNWSNSSTWNGGAKPAANQPVVISNGSTVTLDEDISVSSLTINSGGTFVSSDGSPRTITITRSTNGSSTTLNNLGNWQNGSSISTIIFTGGPSSGDAIHNTSGTIPFQNITVNKTSGSSNVGLSVGSGCTISGTLEIGTGGFISAAPPTGFYLSTAILKFNQGSGATYNVNSGDFSWSTSETPENITISSGTVQLNGDRTASGNLLIDGGTLILDNSASRTLTIQGNWTRSSGSFTPNLGTVVLSGSNNSIIDIGAASPTMYNLTINKSASGTVTLNNNLTITNALTLTSGKLNSGINTIFLSNSATNSLLGGSNSSYIVGNLKRAVAGTGTYVFPIGTATNYLEASINFTTGYTAADLTASYNETTVTTINSGLSSNGQNLIGAIGGGFWTITQGAGASGTPQYNITLKKTDYTADQGNSNVYTIIKRVTGSGNNWAVEGTHAANSSPLSGSTITSTRNGLSTFSDFTIAYSGSTLPVTFTSLTGSIRNGRANLNWNIADEHNVDRYEVEESANGRQFQAFTQVDAASRNSYQATDAQLHTGANYYRVKAVDIDGKLTYSKIIRLDNNSAVDNDIRIYPNPSRGEINLGLNIPAGNYQIRLINAVGQTVYQQPLTHEGGSRSLPVSLPKLSQGIYQMEVRGGVVNHVKSVRIE